MAEPTNRDEYNARFAKSQRIEGYGLEVTINVPCPFCAAPGWAKHRLLEMEQVLSKPHRCDECKRAAKMIFTRSPSGVGFEVVQTDGADIPEWLPPIRRV